jgi:DNA-directed RNA polymerase specialized sigma24 family protein
VKKNNKKKIIKKKNKDNLYGVNEQDFLNVIDIITKKLAYKFKFGYHDIDDMRQQITIFAIEGLKNYDHNRPLENFLWTHVRNRLFNYKRDNYQRPNKPCLTCPFYDQYLKNSNSNCSKYKNKNDCDLFYKWLNRNTNKKNLMHLTTIDDIKDYGNVFETPTDSAQDVAVKEILEKIEDKLNGELREIYLKLKNGVRVNKADSDKLFNHIKNDILDSNNDE